MSTTDRPAKLRAFFAHYVAQCGGARDPRTKWAFGLVPREPFAGPAPWSIVALDTNSGAETYLQTPDDNPAFLYQDVLIALDTARGINIGQPSLHARCLDALAPQPGETVLQVGAGSGYYTAIIAHLVEASGRVHAFEIDRDLARRAGINLANLPWVEVEARSGIAQDLPKVDAVYVNAGITQPSWAWLDALRPGGRLFFPLQPEGGLGGMLWAEKPREGGMTWPARFVSRSAFIPCVGPQDAKTGTTLAPAFARGDWRTVKSLHLADRPDDTCWVKGDDWWLSTARP